MHSDRKLVAALLAICCGMVGFFIWALLQPLRTFGMFVLALVFLVAFFATAVFAAYRLFFFSNDWYRAQAEKQARWQATHPRCMLFLALLTVLTIGWQVFDFIRSRL